MLQDFTKRLSDELQSRIAGLEQSLPARELNAALQAALRKMDLVTREEFDAQAAVLQRTRQRLEALEQQLQAWEAQQTSAEAKNTDA